MNMIAYLLLLITLLFSSCRKNDATVPECIQSKITAFAGYACQSDAKVDQYIFQGQTVFVVSMGFCGGDLPAAVLDENCNELGSLGGFTGNTIINGEEFSNAKHVRTVWSR